MLEFTQQGWLYADEGQQAAEGLGLDRLGMGSMSIES
jgi:hypothetical protein